MDIKAVEQEGLKIKFELFKKFVQIEEGHPGSVLSVFDIVNCIYLGGFIDLDPERKRNDSFIMSKGHAASVQYPYLLRLGFLDPKDWDNWGVTDDTCLRVFGNNSIPGIDVTSGSLGHGLGISAGLAVADRFDGYGFRHYVVISEGELYEGSAWEALLFIAHHRVTQVKIIVDVNRNMILGRPEEHLNLNPIEDKFRSFGFSTRRIDGHDYGAIFSGLEFLNGEDLHEPRVLIADTIKGKGVTLIEDTAQSHYWGSYTGDQIKGILEDLTP